MRVRYSGWTGTQNPFPPDVRPDDVLDAVADDLLEGLTPDEALRKLLGRGLAAAGPRRASGLDGLRRRVEEARRRELERLGLEGPLQRVREQLQALVERERTALEFSAAPDVDAQRAFLDDLPDDPAGRIAELQRYDWTDPRAADEFRRLVEQLRRDVAEASFGQLAQALSAMTSEDVERLRQMLTELDALAAAQERGEDVDERFAAFKERHRDHLPGDPETLDDLLEELARRMAALTRMLAGLDGQQRAQLADLMGQLLGDAGGPGSSGALGDAAERLQTRLQARYPELDWQEPVAGASAAGAEAGSFASTVDWVEHLQELDDLGRALRQDYPGARLEDIDDVALRRALGEEGARELEALRAVEAALERAGAARRVQGRLELTPRGIRRLGDASLARIFARAASDAAGSHRSDLVGGEGELTGATRRWELGDPFRLDVTRTLGNAVTRGGRRPDGRVQLAAEDFELAEAEQRVRVATVLLLDMSFSMPLRGNWVPAKRVALALHALISRQYPEDRFYVVGFSDYARRLRPNDLLATGWERVYGTNMEHAMMLARRLLSRCPGSDNQVLMVTDGEPTAHLEGGVPYFAWPPEPETLRRTIVESTRLARSGATLNVFLLDHDPGAATFVEHMVRGCGGRIFYPDLGDLGSVVVREFLRPR